MSHRPLDLHHLAGEANGRFRDCFDWLEENPEQATRYAVMFGGLLAIYAVYLAAVLHGAQEGSLNANEILRVGHLARFIGFAGWPFAAMRLLAPSWTIRDAANVALSAFAVAAAIWLHRYGLRACLIGLMMLFAPLLFSAGIGHAFGCLRSATDRCRAAAPSQRVGEERRVQTRSWESLTDDRP